MDNGSIAQWAIGVLLGSVGGALATLVVFRVRLATMQHEIENGTAALERHIASEQAALDRLEKDLAARIERVDKRQVALLKLTADIARKVGVDNRQLDDALVRMLTDDPEKA